MKKRNAANCKHEKFSGAVEVGRIVDKLPIEFVVDVMVICDQCGLPFRFDADLGQAKGVALSGDRYKLRARLQLGEKALAASAGSQIQSLDSKYDTQ